VVDAFDRMISSKAVLISWNIGAVLLAGLAETILFLIYNLSPSFESCYLAEKK